MTAPAQKHGHDTGQGSSHAPAPEAPAPTPPVAIKETRRVDTAVDVNKFKVRDAVFYCQNGEWKRGVLDAKPTKKHGNIMIQLSGIEGAIELESGLYRVDFAGGEEIVSGGKTYTVLKTYPAEDGRPLYDLAIEKPENNKMGINQETIIKWKESGDKKIVIENKIADGKNELEIKAAELLGNIKLVKGQAATEFAKNLNALEQMAHEMEKELANAGEDLTKLKDAEKKIAELRTKAKKDGEVLDKKIAEAVEKERNVESTLSQREIADIAQAIFDDKAEGVDQAAISDHKSKLVEWDQKNTAYTAWEAEVKSLNDRATAIKEKTDPIHAQLKSLKQGSPERPGNKPELKKPSEERKSELWAEVFEGMSQRSNSEPVLSSKFEKAKEEIDVRRKAKAKTMVLADFPSGTPDERVIIKKKNIEYFEAIVGDWKKLEKEIAPINFETEKVDLKTKGTELEVKAHSLGKTDLVQEINNKISSFATINSVENLIDAWHDLGTLEIKLLEAEHHATTEHGHEDNSVETRGSVEGTVDLPQAVIKELLLANAEGVKAAMAEAYAVLTEPERSQTNLKQLLRQFFEKANIDSGTGERGSLSLRQRLAQAGVPHWEAFVEKFQGPLTEKLAGVLLQAADAELKTFLTQNIGDIKRLADGRESGWGNIPGDILEEISHSALWKMKGALGGRTILNSALVGGAAISAGMAVNLIPFMPGVVKAGAVGGFVGAVKAGLQRWMGKDTNIFQKEAVRAKSEVEKDKKRLISDALIKRMFGVGENGEVTLKRSNELGHFFATSIRRATAGKKDELVLKDHTGAVAVTLTGDAVCLYHEALKRASINEGIEIGDQARINCALAIHALYNNKKPVVDVPPKLQKALEWLTDSYSGRTQVTANKDTVASVPGVKKPDTEQVGALRQGGVTTVLGASVGVAAYWDNIYVRGGIGFSYGSLRGQKSQYESDQRNADKTSREKLDNLIHFASEFLNENRPIDRENLKIYRDLAVAITGGKKFVLSEAVDKKTLDQDLAEAVDYFSTNSHDASSLVWRDQKMRDAMESLQLELQKAELKLSFSDAVSSMQNTNIRLIEEAKNSGGEKVFRSLKRQTRSVVYGLVGGKISLVIGGYAAGIFRREMGIDQTHSGPEAQPAESATTAKITIHDPVVPVEIVPQFSQVEQSLIDHGISPDDLASLKDHLVSTGNNVEKVLESITVQHDAGHNSITALFQRQLELDPTGHGYHGKLDDFDSLHRWSMLKARDIAIEKGYIDLHSGKQTWLLENKDGKPSGFVILHKKDGAFEVKMTGAHAQDVHHLWNKEPAKHEIEPEKSAPTVKVEPEIAVGKLGPTGYSLLGEELKNPFNEPVFVKDGISAPHVSTEDSSISGGSSSALGSGGSGESGASRAYEEIAVNKAIDAARTEIAKQVAFKDWALKTPAIQPLLIGHIVSPDQANGLIDQWVSAHKTDLGSAKGDFENWFTQEALKMREAMRKAGSIGRDTVPKGTIITTGKAAAPAPTDNLDEMAEKLRASIKADEAVGSNTEVDVHTPVIVEPARDGNSIVHFLYDDEEKTIKIPAVLSPEASNDAHSPLLMKLSASGTPIRVHLEMHHLPGKSEDIPVVVYENHDKHLDEIYRISDNKLDKLKDRPTS